MGGLIVEAAAVLNEDNPEFFEELMKKGVDAVEPEMKKQQKKRKKYALDICFNPNSYSLADGDCYLVSHKDYCKMRDAILGEKE